MTEQPEHLQFLKFKKENKQNVDWILNLYLYLTMPVVMAAAASSHSHRGPPVAGANAPGARTENLNETALDEMDVENKKEEQPEEEDTEGYNEEEDYLYVFPPKSKRKGDLNMKVLMSG